MSAHRAGSAAARYPADVVEVNKPHVTREAYLARERAASERSTLWRGEVRAMTGASLVHNVISSNIHGLLFSRLMGTPCRPLSQDMRVHVPATGGYVYPDVLVVCGKPELEDEAFDTLLNPSVIIEVLSDSTRRFDREEKYSAYKSIASLREYVLVEQDRPWVEVLTRTDDGWLSRDYAAGADVRLTSLALEIPMDEICRDALSAS